MGSDRYATLIFFNLYSLTLIPVVLSTVFFYSVVVVVVTPLPLHIPAK